MQSFDNSLRNLIDSNTITQSEAYIHARNKADFEINPDTNDNE